MSRFEELMNEAIGEVMIGEALVIEALAPATRWRGGLRSPGSRRSRPASRSGSPRRPRRARAGRWA
jgi:hypothetical protein